MRNIKDKNRTTIGLLPYELGANAYIKQNRKILDRVGHVVPVPKPLPLLKQALGRLLTSGTFRLYDVLIVNWRENTLTNGRNQLHVFGVIEYFISLIIHRLVSKNFIYVMHNSHPHNLPTESISSAQKIVTIGQLLANTIVLHSPVKAMKSTKSVYVPHPLYETFQHSSLEKFKELNKNEFIMIGRVQPYKKIDEVISSWTSSSKLVIMGPCSDKKYLSLLKQLAINKHVEFEIDFHTENYLAERVGSSQGIIITNDSNSMLVSGSFFFAISCGTPIYATSSDFFEWIKTTELSEFVSIHKTVESLLDNIPYDRKVSLNQREKLLDQAKLLFGELTTEEHWKKAITKN